MYQKARQTVLASRLYRKMKIKRDLYQKFAAHSGIMVVFGAEALPTTSRRVEYKYIESGHEKPILYLTIDANNAQLFDDVKPHLESAQNFAAFTDTELEKYFQDLELLGADTGETASSAQCCIITQ